MDDVYDIIRTAAARQPEKTALICGSTSSSYEKFFAQIETARRFFSSRYNAGDVVSLHAENSPEWLIVYFGIIGAGCMVHPIGLRASDEQIQFQIRFSGSRALIFSPRTVTKAGRLQLDASVERLSFEEILSSSEAPAERERSLYSALLYTSGTTSSPKAIRLPHTVVLAATHTIAECLGITPEDVYYQILPLSHSFGLGNVHATFLAGGTVVIAEQTINYEEALADILHSRATFFATVPLTLHTMTREKPEAFAALASQLKILCTNTNPMPEAVSRHILSALPKTRFFTYYGLTEASRSTFMPYHRFPEKLLSVGPPAPRASIRIDESGEIWIAGPHVVSEYWKNEEATARSFKDGYIRTGDVGHMDTEGFLYITGRTDDIINIAGEKVSLQEVDLAIGSLPDVKDVMSIERPDIRQDYVITAYIVRSPEAAGSEEEMRNAIIAHCKKVLDNYKVPREIHFVETLPRTEQGKAKRQELRNSLSMKH